MKTFSKNLMIAITLTACCLIAPAGFAQGPIATYTLSASGAVADTTSGGSSAVVTGYSLIEANAGSPEPSGLAIFGFRQNGTLISETGVPAVPLIQSGRIYAETNGSVSTGLAIANPNATDATISFYFTDATGTNMGAGSMTLQANGQISKFLNQDPFNGSGALNGTFTFNSSIPVAAIALRGLTNERGEFLMTTLPVADLSASSNSSLVFPHFADGGGWITKLVLVNPTDSVMSGTAQFFASGSGTTTAPPTFVTINGQTNDTFTYLIQPRSSQAMITAGLQSGVQVGSIQLTPVPGSRSPVGVGIFSYSTNGVTVTEAGVPGLPSAAALRLFAETSSTAQLQTGWMETGVAVANPSSQAATVTFVLTDQTGATVATGVETIPPMGKISKFLGEISGFASVPHPFQGVLSVRTDQSAGISVLGLRGRYNERGEFLITTTSPVDESLVQNGTLVFPHFADGGGYTTEFVVFSASGQASSGTLVFISPTGSQATVSFGTSASLSLNSITVNPATVTAGSSTTMTVTLNSPAPSGGATVSLSSSNTALSVPANIMIAAGQTVASVQVQAANVSSSTSTVITATYAGVNLATTVAVSAAGSGSTGSGSSAMVSGLTVSPSSISSGSTATVTVTLNAPAPASGATVNLSSSNSAALAVPATITIPSGQTTGSVQVQAGSTAASTSVTVAGAYNNSSQSATVTVTSAAALPTLSALSISPSTVTGGLMATVTITLTGPAPVGGAVVSLSSSNSVAAQVPGSITIPAGQSSASFQVQSAAVVAATSSTIGAIYNNSTVNSNLIVMP